MLNENICNEVQWKQSLFLSALNEASQKNNRSPHYYCEKSKGREPFSRGGGGVCVHVCSSICQFREWLPSIPRVLSLTSLASSRAPISPFLRVPPTVQPGFCFRSQTPGEASDWVATQEGPSSSRGQWESLWTWSWLGSSRLSILESACALAALKVWYI